MTEISFNKNIYVYGTNLELDIGKPLIDRVGSISVYAHPLKEYKKNISSLEGYFITEIPLIKKEDKGVRKDWQLEIPRTQMKNYADIYQGEFIPF